MSRALRHAPLLLLLALLPAALAGSRLGRQLPAYDMQPVTDLVGSGVASLPLDGASLLLAKDGQVIYQRTFGSFTPDTAVPIASGSKWLSATVIMTLVDDGRRSVDVVEGACLVRVDDNYTVIPFVYSAIFCSFDTGGIVAMHTGNGQIGHINNRILPPDIGHHIHPSMAVGGL